MPVSGLVVTLCADKQLRMQAMEALRRHPKIEVGTVEFQRAAVVVDSASRSEDKEIWDWLQQLEGVVFVDVAMVGFDEEARPSGDVASSCGTSEPERHSLDQDKQPET